MQGAIHCYFSPLRRQFMHFSFLSGLISLVVESRSRIPLEAVSRQFFVRSCGYSIETGLQFYLHSISAVD